eukprot:6277259-Prymnesium_polylepis.1
MVDDLACSGAAPRALLPLTSLRLESAKAPAASFNIAQYYREVTSSALDAQRETMEALVDPSSWEGLARDQKAEGPPEKADDEVATRMRR